AHAIRRDLATLCLASEVSRLLDRLRRELLAWSRPVLLRGDVRGGRAAMAREVDRDPGGQGATRAVGPPMAAAHGHQRGARRRVDPGGAAAELSDAFAIGVSDATHARSGGAARDWYAAPAAPRDGPSGGRAAGGSTAANKSRRIGLTPGSSPG